MDRLDRITIGNHVGDVMNRHTRSRKDRLAAENVGITRHHRLSLAKTRKTDLHIGGDRLEVDLQGVRGNHRCSVGCNRAFDDAPPCRWRQRVGCQPGQAQPD